MGDPTVFYSTNNIAELPTCCNIPLRRHDPVFLSRFHYTWCLVTLIKAWKYHICCHHCCRCLDIDECKNKTDGCDTSDRALCINTAGSYRCACKPGYTGEGTTGTCKKVSYADVSFVILMQQSYQKFLQNKILLEHSAILFNGPLKPEACFSDRS